ncbi:hypothetical protein F4780DRAFT_789285 [Xylariomycetidae sp. FL0641]|nr:hypothetical protein F4780DRAFT_789285 [Xylariomycetidae sp. FL0641]
MSSKSGGVPEIPGYYYDTEKRRYFKIEKNSQAPSGAAWAADNVKKRRLQDEEATAARRRMDLRRRRVARSRALAEPLMGGFLAREYGEAGRDMPAASFAAGLLEKGQMPLADARWGSSANVKHMYVSGQDTKTGLCTAYATLDELTLMSTYIPRDKNGRIHRRLLANYLTPQHRLAPYQELAVPQISDIKYHEGSGQILVTSRSPGADVSVWGFAPTVTDADDRRPHWLLGSNTVYMNSRTHQNRQHSRNHHNDYQANCIAPAPAGASVVGVVGTNRGLAALEPSGFLGWVSSSSSASASTAGWDRDIFAVDFQPAHRSVLRFGGRPGRLVTADLRVPADKWPAAAAARLPAPATHVRALNEHQTLVAGLRSHLAVYDARFVKGGSSSSFSSPPEAEPGAATFSRGDNKRTSRGSSSSNKGPPTDVDVPVLAFPAYRNAAHTRIGLDLDPGGSGLVAAAHDDGVVALYCARSGRRLRAPAVDRVRSPRGGPVQCLQFQACPGDPASTLFAGVGSNVCAYSFGVEACGDEA